MFLLQATWVGDVGNSKKELATKQANENNLNSIIF